MSPCRVEATCKMHPIGLRHFHELVPLPQFEEEDSGFYFFLAQISLRKFLTQTLEVVGYCKSFHTSCNCYILTIQPGSYRTSHIRTRCHW